MTVRLKHKGQDAFTLLELLMVVIIIAILASLALPQYLRVAERARASESMTLMASIRGSELRFRAADPAGQFTQDLSALDIELPNVVLNSGDTDVNLANWTITVNGTDPTTSPNTVATRTDGSGRAIDMDLSSGETCANDPVYGLPAGGVLPNCP